ncbi:hypothetical protein EON81_08890 [bacterium]|nr:MAG: hypothetical protein EON81_08890 [bacterium]
MLTSLIFALAVHAAPKVTATYDFDRITSSDFGAAGETTSEHGKATVIIEGGRTTKTETVGDLVNETSYDEKSTRWIKRRGKEIIEARTFNIDSPEFKEFATSLMPMVADLQKSEWKKDGRLRVNGILCDLSAMKTKVMGQELQMTTANPVDEEMARCVGSIQSQTFTESEGKIGMLYESKYNVKLRKGR